MEATEDWELVGYLAPGKEAEFGEHTGRVSRVLANGSAFVDCPELKELYGQDPYVHSTVVAQCALQVGDEIAFNVHVSSRGMPQVSAPCWRRARPGGDEPGEPPPKRARVGYAPPSGAALPALAHGPWAASAKGYGKGAWVEAPWPKAPGTGVPSSWAKDGVMADFDKYIMGTVKTPIPSKGFSLVEAPDSGHEADVYVHSSVAPPEALQPGEVVAFRLHISPKGQPQASAPLWKLIGTPLDESPAQLGEFVGQFNKMLPGGSGFVSCPALKEEYGRDTYVHVSVIIGLGLELGDVVAFPVQLTPDGKPQVQAPCWRCCTPAPGGSGTTAPGDGGFQDTAWAVFEQYLASRRGATNLAASPARAAARGWQALPWQAGGVSLPAEELPTEIPVEWMPDNHVVGVVKHADEVRGLSYVHSPGSGFERDVFVHKSVADPGSLTVGEYVCFPLHVNAKGQPQGSAPFWKRAGPAEADKPVEFGKYEGQIVRVLANGSAFVDCEDVRLAYGTDGYVHESVMAQCNLSEGNLIRFNIHVNQKGKPQVSPPCWTCCSSPEVMSKLLSGAAQAPQEGGEPTPPALDAPAAAGAAGQGGSQWSCAECGFSNRPSNEVCGGWGPMGCKAPRPAAPRPAAPKPAAPKPAAQKPAAPKPAAQRPAAQRPAAQGPAAQRQTAGKGAGPAGKSASPTASASQASKPRTFNISAAVSAAPRAAAVQDNGRWACAACGFGNSPDNNVCGGKGPMGCKAARPEATLPWTCPCGFANKAINEVCGGRGAMGCKRPRTPAAGGPRGGSAKGGRGAAGQAADGGKAPAVLWPSAAAAAPKSKAAARPTTTPRPPSASPLSGALNLIGMLRPRAKRDEGAAEPFSEAEIPYDEAEEEQDALAMLDDTGEEDPYAGDDADADEFS